MAFLHILLLCTFIKGLHTTTRTGSSYSEHRETSIETQGDVMQNSFYNLFDWTKPTPTSKFAEGFMNSETGRDFLQTVSQECPKQAFYFGMNPQHMSAMSRLKKLLTEQLDANSCLQMAAALREHHEINPSMWFQAVLSVSIQRRDLQGLRKPLLTEIMPDIFIPKEVLNILKLNYSFYSKNPDQCVRIDGSVGRDNGPENLLWYWREDVLANSHHLYWHLSYPINGESGKPDRGGELFYFFHHNMLARFHAERLSVGLPPVTAHDLRPGSIIPFGYSPHLFDSNSGRNYSTRPAGVPVLDVTVTTTMGSNYFVSARNRSIQLSRILDGISKDILKDECGRSVYLKNDAGIDLLGNTVQANIFSVNPEYYGYNGVHNTGHHIIGLASNINPQMEVSTVPGVMEEDATSMRDIMFYPFHTSIDSIFKRHKNRLEPYMLNQGDWPLLVPGIKLLELTIQARNSPNNVLHTLWRYRRYNVARGLDFTRSFMQGPLFVCHQQLDHQEFEYEIKIQKDEYAQKMNTATVRLFLGPKHDLNGRPYNVEEQRDLMFIMDTFTISLKMGINIVRRKSTETQLTIDYSTSLDILRLPNESSMPFCGCGWPQHLLIPKGTKEGLEMYLFAMITNDDESNVKQMSSNETQSCQQAYIMCGIFGEKYPDARPMNYPFDRRLYAAQKEDDGLEQVVRNVPNMAITQVKILHSDEFRDEFEV